MFQREHEKVTFLEWQYIVLCMFWNKMENYKDFIVKKGSWTSYRTPYQFQ